MHIIREYIIEPFIQHQKDVDKIIPTTSHNGVYQILLAMKYLRASNQEWMEFVNKLEKLLEENQDVIDLAAMNMPIDWKEHLNA